MNHQQPNNQEEGSSGMKANFVFWSPHSCMNMDTTCKQRERESGGGRKTQKAKLIKTS